MADDADIIEVEIEPDAGETNKQTDTGKTETTVKTADPVNEFKSQFEELKSATEKTNRELAESRIREAAATQEAVRARQEATVAKAAVADSELDAVESGLSAAKSEGDAAEQAFVAAQEAGDWKAAAKAQRAMAAAEARIVRLDEAKSDIEVRKAQGGKVEERQAQQHQQADPVEQLISRHTPRAQAWLRDHKDFITDQKKNAKLQAAHHDAIGEGLAPDTDQYVEHVETFLGLRTTGADKTNGMQPKRRITPPVAAGGAAPGGTNGGGETVRLTKGEATAATDGTHVWGQHDLAAGRIKDKSLVGQPIGHQEMARRKLALQGQGAYDRAYVEQ